MRNVIGFKCIKCNNEYELKDAEYVCPSCFGNLQVVYDYDYIKSVFKRDDLTNNRDYTIFRYLPFLPIEKKEFIPKLSIGWTPLYKPLKLANQLGLRNLYLKDDGKNPSGSFKDRAGAIAVINAKEKGAKTITGASTGNAASSLSCITSTMEIKTIIFVPKTAPKAKITQLLIFGASVLTVDGTYDDAFDLCLEATAKYGWYNRNTGYNPFTREGKKTAAFEIAEQMDWNLPDYVVVPVGDGNIISGIWKGFKDLYNTGFIDRLPKLIAAQAENSNSISAALNTDGIIKEVSGNTIADSISVSIPRDGDAAVLAVKESEGFAIEVSDNEILNAIKDVARGSGVFGEPAGVTPYAALKKAVQIGKITSEDTVLIMMTGNGLKDIDSAMKSVGEPYLIKPELSELDALINRL